jgi:hypothetical protein
VEKKTGTNSYLIFTIKLEQQQKKNSVKTFFSKNSKIRWKGIIHQFTWHYTNNQSSLFPPLWFYCWSLYYVSFHLRLLITSVVSVGHCIACPFIYGFWLPLWYLLVIVLLVLSFTASDYLCGIFWSLYCLSFHLRLLITSVVSFGHCITCPFIFGFWLPLWYHRGNQKP